MRSLLLWFIFSLLIVASAAVPLQSDDEIQSEDGITEANNPVEDDDEPVTESPDEISISFCSPACGEATINPCGANGECAEGHKCCLDMCLSSTVCRPISISKELYPESYLVPELEDEMLSSPINTEEGSELVGRKSSHVEDISGLKRSAQYDALTYALSPAEYHKAYPWVNEPLSDTDFDDNSDDLTVTTKAASESDTSSVLFSSRKRRRAQDETGGFPHIPVHTYEISDSRQKRVQAFERFKSDRFDQDDNDGDDNNDRYSNNDRVVYDNDDAGAVDDNERNEDGSENEEIEGEIEPPSDMAENDGVVLEETLEYLEDSIDTNQNIAITKRKRSTELNYEEKSTDIDETPETYINVRPHQVPPTLIFIKKVPGLTLSDLVHSGQATVTKIVAPLPMKPANYPDPDELPVVANTESPEEIQTTLGPESIEADEAESKET